MLHKGQFRHTVLKWLVEFSRRLGVPLKTVLLAAHLKVVAALVNLSEVVTGVISNGRLEETDGERVLGLFLNTLPLRFTLSGEPWPEMVRQLYAMETRCSRHRRFPIADILLTIGNTALFDIAL